MMKLIDRYRMYVSSAKMLEDVQKIMPKGDLRIEEIQKSIDHLYDLARDVDLIMEYNQDHSW